MRVALDTNRITDLFRGDLELAEQLGTAEEVWIPLFALGEMKAGFQGGTQQRRNESLLNRLLAKPTVGVLLPGRETAEHYARIFVQLRRAGSPCSGQPSLDRSAGAGTRPRSHHARPALRANTSNHPGLTVRIS